MIWRRAMTLAILGAGALGATGAHAQLNNEPFSFRGQGAVGMSPAYRQAILLREIDGGLPNVLYKDRDGGLAIPVRTRGNQAVLRRPASPFVLTGPGEVAGGLDAKFAAVTFGGGGISLGWFRSGGGGLPAQPISYAPGAVAIDLWIAQLEGLEPLASQ